MIWDFMLCGRVSSHCWRGSYHLVSELRFYFSFIYHLNFVFLYAFEDSNFIRAINSITMFLAFFGFVFFFVGRSLGKDDKTVKILGIFDILATVSVIAIYILAFLAMEM